MNKFSKKSAFGIATVAAATALVAGFAAPAMASTGHSGSAGSDSKWTSTSSTTRDTSTMTRGQFDALRNANIADGQVSNWSPVVVSPDVSLGDVASGNAVGSGNDIPLLSGNTISGNTTSVPIGSGNDTAVGNNDGNGSISSDVNNLVHNLLNGNSASGSSSSTSSSNDLGTGSNGLDLGSLLGGR